MKRTLSSLAALVAVSLGTTAYAQVYNTRLNEMLNKREISLEEAAIAAVVAKSLNLDVNYLFGLSRDYGMPVYRIAPCLYLDRYSDRDFNHIYTLRQQGLGWGEIAHRLGIHPGTFNKMRKKGDFERVIWGDMLYKGYGYKPEDLVGLLDPKTDWKKWVVAGVTSNGDRAKFKGRLNKPSTPAKMFDSHPSETHGSQGKGKGKGKGKGGW